MQIDTTTYLLVIVLFIITTIIGLIIYSVQASKEKKMKKDSDIFLNEDLKILKKTIINSKT